MSRAAGAEFRIKDEGFRLRAIEPTDVALVNVKPGPNGYTGWHEHVSRSLVIVKTGQITVYAPARSRGARRPGEADREQIYIVDFVPEEASRGNRRFAGPRRLSGVGVTN
jgi:hypothetical protein